LFFWPSNIYISGFWISLNVEIGGFKLTKLSDYPLFTSVRGGDAAGGIIRGFGLWPTGLDSTSMQGSIA
jgi:hypothetical protein